MTLLSAVVAPKAAHTAIACVLTSLLLAQSAGAEAVPYSRISVDITGDVLANGSIKSGIPVLVVAGFTYKAADLAQALGNAAEDHQNQWLDAQLVVVGEDAKRLKAIVDAGDSLNGSAARAIAAHMENTSYAMTVDQKSPVGYTLKSVIDNLGYASVKVGIDKAVEASIGAAFQWLGVNKLVSKKVNWMVNYNGPLEDFEKGLGWGKLGTRARLAQAAAEELMKATETQAISHFLEGSRRDNLERAADDALGQIYQNIMEEHPSQPRTVIVSAYRLEVARAAVMLPAAAVPAMAAARAAAPVIEAEPEPEDQVVRTIRSDDEVATHYSNPQSQERNTYTSSQIQIPVAQTRLRRRSGMRRPRRAAPLCTRS